MSNKKVNRQAGIHLHKTDPKQAVRRSKNGATHGPTVKPEFYWILIARNGKTIARSSETYKRKAGAVKSIVVAAAIFLGGNPYELIPYYDHTLDGTPKKHC